MITRRYFYIGSVYGETIRIFSGDLTYKSWFPDPLKCFRDLRSMQAKEFNVDFNCINIQAFHRI